MPEYLIKDRATGLYFVDMSVRGLMISTARADALRLSDAQAAQCAIAAVSKVSGSFDWQAEEA